MNRPYLFAIVAFFALSSQLSYAELLPTTDVSVTFDQYSSVRTFDFESLQEQAKQAAREAHAPYVSQMGEWDNLPADHRQSDITLQIIYFKILSNPSLTDKERGALVHNEWLKNTGFKKYEKARSAYEAALQGSNAEEIEKTQKAFQTRTAQIKPYAELPESEQQKDFDQLSAARKALLQDAKTAFLLLNPTKDTSVLISDYPSAALDSAAIRPVAEAAAKMAHLAYVASMGTWDTLSKTVQDENIRLQLTYIRILATPGLTDDERGALAHNQWIHDTGKAKLKAATDAYNEAWRAAQLLTPEGGRELDALRDKMNTRIAQNLPYADLSREEQLKDFGQLDSARSKIHADEDLGVEVSCLGSLRRLVPKI